jgi:HSP20 family protein
MSAQTASQSPSRSGEQSDQKPGLTRRSGLPSLPSLLLDPLRFFGGNSFSLLRSLQEDMARNMASLDRSEDLSSAAWVPAIEVNYRDGNLEVSAELPGIRNEDVTVEINNNVLVIQGERKQEQERNEGGVRRTERQYGRFYRAIALPEGADVANARAEFGDGVLRINIPVPQEQSSSRQIEVQSGASSKPTQPSSGGEQQPAASGSTIPHKAA